MSEIKIGTGNGQGSCYGCEQKGKWNRSWVNLLYEYEDKLWCEDCLIARLHKENQELKNRQKQFIEYLENESKEVIRDAGYHQRICLEFLDKYKEIIGGDNK